VLYDESSLCRGCQVTQDHNTALIVVLRERSGRWNVYVEQAQLCRKPRYLGQTVCFPQNKKRIPCGAREISWDFSKKLCGPSRYVDRRYSHTRLLGPQPCPRTLGSIKLESGYPPSPESIFASHALELQFQTFDPSRRAKPLHRTPSIAGLHVSASLGCVLLVSVEI
jgi:hypothetical protein